MKFGFLIRRLSLQGPRVPASHLDLNPGLNVISGPSDTGKTFIAQCIDFVMGSSKPPRDIREAEGYDEVLLHLETREGVRLVLARALRGGDVRVSSPGREDVIVSAKHAAGKSDTISQLLLDLCGLTEKKIRTNQRGTTRPLSFRDIARLTIIDEESVISATSPVLSGQHISKTAECGVFRLLLTGVDDSTVLSKEDPKVSRSRNEGKIEVIQALRQRALFQLEQMGEKEDLRSVNERLSSLEIDLARATSDLVTDQELVGAAEERRRDAWATLRKIESRIAVQTELHGRFLLLQSQYHSDLRRLAAIAESGIRLAQLTTERCPVCGAEADDQDHEHRHAAASPEAVSQSCLAEAAKINNLLHDLQETLSDNATQIGALERDQARVRGDLQDNGDQLKELLQPRLQSSAERLRYLQESLESGRRKSSLLERLEELNNLLSDASAPSPAPKADGPPTKVSAGETEKLCKEIEELLRSWHYPNLDRVTFSEDDQDIIISGRPRASHGKGVRALTRAAFNLGLLRHCANESRPTPGFVLIDSPLVVYREPDTDEGAFPHDVKDAFYRSISANFKDLQVIILENDDPPSDLQADANLVAFTGTGHGRRGFIH